MGPAGSSLNFVCNGTPITMPTEWQLEIGAHRLCPGPVSTINLPDGVDYPVELRAEWRGVPIASGVFAPNGDVPVDPRAELSVVASAGPRPTVYWSTHTTPESRTPAVHTGDRTAEAVPISVAPGSVIRTSVYFPGLGVVSEVVEPLRLWEIRTYRVGPPTAFGTITGTVTDESGQPVPECEIDLVAYYPNPDHEGDFWILARPAARLFGLFHESITTDADGRFVLHDAALVGNVPYRIRNRDRRYVPVGNLGSTLRWSGAGEAQFVVRSPRE